MIRKTLVSLMIPIAFGAVVSADSVIVNGKFEKPLAPWKVVVLKDGPETEKSVDDGVLTIKALGASDKRGKRQLAQSIKVESGKTYRLTFDVKGTLEGESEMVVAIIPKGGKSVFFRKVPITAEWEGQKFKVVPKEMPEGSEPMLKFLLGKLKGDISLRNVSLEVVEAK